MAKNSVKKSKVTPIAPRKNADLDRTYKNSVALSDKTKREVVKILNVKLAAATDMYSQAKFAHWNVKGINFYQLHLVFDSVADQIFEHIDPIAERITQLGGVAKGTIRLGVSGSPLAEYDTTATSGPEHLKALIASLAKYAEELRSASEDIDEAGDEPTSDFFKQLVLESEKQLYFLESHLEAGDVQ